MPNNAATDRLMCPELQTMNPQYMSDISRTHSHHLFARWRAPQSVMQGESTEVKGGVAEYNMRQTASPNRAIASTMSETIHHLLRPHILRRARSVCCQTGGGAAHLCTYNQAEEIYIHLIYHPSEGVSTYTISLLLQFVELVTIQRQFVSTST